MLKYFVVGVLFARSWRDELSNRDVLSALAAGTVCPLMA